MAEETSLLQQAFAETGVQLDRIIDAYERTVPYVPSNYPRYFKIMENRTNYYAIIKIDFDSFETVDDKLIDKYTCELIETNNSDDFPPVPELYSINYKSDFEYYEIKCPENVCIAKTEENGHIVLGSEIVSRFQEYNVEEISL